MQGRPPEEEGTGGEVDTGLGPPLAKADAVATAAAGHPLGAAVAEATAAALLDQPAEVRLPGTVLHALSADHLQGEDFDGAYVQSSNSYVWAPLILQVPSVLMQSVVCREVDGSPRGSPARSISRSPVRD